MPTISHYPGDFFIPAFQCPHRVERIGTLGDGGKWVCGADRIAKQDKCVIYSFGLPPLCLFPVASIPLLALCNLAGVNNESSFEADLLRRAPGCEAWGYDYSVDRVRVPWCFFCRGTHCHFYLSLASGDPRSVMIPSWSLGLTLNPGRLAGPTTTRKPISPGIGLLIRSWSSTVRFLIRRFPFIPKT